MQTTGEKIKSRRTALGISQEDLAIKTGFSALTIMRYELNRRSPQVDDLKLIAEALEIPVSELL